MNEFGLGFGYRIRIWKPKKIWTHWVVDKKLNNYKCDLYRDGKKIKRGDAVTLDFWTSSLEGQNVNALVMRKPRR